MKICKIDGCEKKHHARGYCSKHWQKNKKYNDPLFAKIEMHGMEKSLEYQTWLNIKKRCFSVNGAEYKNYGGRGITICDEWLHSFTAFFRDMGKKPFPKAQIDRIDNDGNYEPGNCRWVTQTENIRNSSTPRLTVEKVREIRKLKKSREITNVDIAKIYNVTPALIGYILKNKIWKESA